MNICALEDLADKDGFITDGDWIESKDQDQTGKIRLIQLADIGDGKFLNKSKKFINKATLEKLNCTLLNEGDVLIARMPDPLGRCCVFPKLDKQAITVVDICIIRPNNKLADKDWLAFYLNSPAVRREIQSHAQGATRARVPTGKLKKLSIDLPTICQQKSVAAQLREQINEYETVVEGVKVQLVEINALENSIIYQSLKKSNLDKIPLEYVLEEIKKGIGEDWKKYPVWGATRKGLAPAKEPPGKKPHRYKPVFPGTVFYNPMRILIGSIAFVDEGNPDGITSPDYVALKGKKGVVDSRWFYYWLRSPLGERCIKSLARGGVRERMLFNRLKQGEIELPSYEAQLAASKALKELVPLRENIENQLKDIDALPAKLLAKAFEM